MGGQGLLGVALPPAEVLLAPAAAALSLSVALGAVAFERDLRGYHFGWRQVASLVAAAAVFVAVVPTVAGAVDGRWNLAGTDDAAQLSFLDRADVQDQGAFRVLWLGDPEVLPVASFRLDDDLAYGFSEDGTGSLTELSRMNAQREVATLGRGAVGAILAAKLNEVVVEPGPGGIFVAKVGAVHNGDVATLAQMTNQARGQISNELGKDYQDRVFQATRDAVKVELFLDNARRAVGASPEEAPAAAGKAKGPAKGKAG